MSAAHYVGRVGGLATFLGIGSAVLFGSGNAWADDTGAAGSQAPSGRGHSASASREPGAPTSPRTRGLVTPAAAAAVAPSLADGDVPSIATPGRRGVVSHRAPSPVIADDVTATTAAAVLSGTATTAPRLSAAAADPAPNGFAVPSTTASSAANSSVVRPAPATAAAIAVPAVPSASVQVSSEPAPSPSTSAKVVSAEMISPPVNHNAFDLLGFLATAATNLEQALFSAFARPTDLVGSTATPGTFTGQPSLLQQAYVGVLRVLKSQLSATGDAGPLTSVEPPWYFTVGLNVTTSQFDGMPVYVLQRTWAQSDREVVYLHGGGYTAQPLIFQWLNVADYARQTGATIIAPIYPLGGKGGNAESVVPAMADLLTQVINERGARNISVLGDSAGGGLALAAVQEQIRRGDTTPNSMVLLSPWLDVTLSDPRSHQIDDPLLDADNLVARGKLWADTLDPTDPRVSPLFGSLAGIPPTTVYSGSMDLLYPDSVLLQEKAIAEGAPITFGLRSDSVHAWGVFPFLPETQSDRPDIYTALNLL